MRVGAGETLTLSKDRFSAWFALICGPISEEFATRYNEELVVNRKVLDTCYIRAIANAPLFNCDNGINYNREAGLLAYWIIKLKPIVVQVEDDEHRTHLLNEYTAFWFASSFIRYAHREILSEEKFSEYVPACEKLQDINLRNADAMQDRLVNALRYQVFASGSLPTLLEALYYLPVDDFAAYPKDE